MTNDSASELTHIQAKIDDLGKLNAPGQTPAFWAAVAEKAALLNSMGREERKEKKAIRESE